MEHLESQIGLRVLSEKQQILVEHILGNLDGDGYLRRELENIVDDLAFTQNLDSTEEELEVVLEVVQDLDPAGVGARSLKECLMLQMQRKDLEDELNKLAYTILDKYFDEFTKKHYEKIKARLDIDDDELERVVALKIVIETKEQEIADKKGGRGYAN